MIQKFYKVLALLLLASGPFLVQAQSTTITTDPNFTGGTFFAAPAQIAFVVENTNAGGILITGITHYCQTSENNSVWELYYSSASISGPSSVPSADWNLIATSLPTPVTADGVVPIPFQSLSFLVPGGTTYRFAIKGIGPGNVRYASAALAANTFTSAGVNVHIGTHQINGLNVGYSGNGTTLTTTPRYWVGGVTFQPDGPCTGAFTDTAMAFPASICVGSSTVLSSSNTSSGIGATYQWQSSADSITFTDLIGANTSTYSVTPPVTTYYRLIVGCGSASDTSTITKVDVIGAVIPAGTYTIGAAPSDYLTLEDALTAINCGGIGGPVTLAMKPGTYTGNYVIGNFAGAASGLTISSQTSNPTDVIFTNGGNGNTFDINGATNVTISAISIINATAPTSASAGIFINNSSTVTVTGCIIEGNNGSTSTNNRAIYATNSSSLLIISNQIRNAYYGVYHSGNASPNYSAGNQYIGNIISNCYYYGIYLVNNQLSVIDGNQISDFQSNVSSQAIYVSRAQDMTITNNRISGSLGIYGIFMSNMNLSATPGGQNLVANNSIAADFSSATPRAIYGAGVSTDTIDAVTVVHNSIEIRSNSTSTTANGAIYFTGGTATTPLWSNITLLNNSVKVIRQTTGTNMAGVYLSGNFIKDSLISNNNLYFLDVTNPAGEYRIVSTNYSLAAWTTFSNQDANSVVADPLYTSATDLNPLSVSPLKDAATPLSYVTTDINGLTRGAIPDIGAFEIQLVANDLLAVDILTPSSVITGGTALPVSFRFKNVGTATLTSVTVGYQFANNAPVIETFTGSVAPEDTATYTFTSTLTVPVGVSGVLSVWTSGPNGQADPTPGNDTLTQILCQALAGGTYTVGGATSDFPSFDVVAEVLNCGGITGPVVLQSQAPGALSTGSIRLGVINGASATNTLTIDGNGDTLLFSQGETPHIVVLDGAKHVRLRNIVLTGPGNITGVLLKDVEDIQIVRTTILLDTTSTSTLTGGIVGSGSYTAATTATLMKDVLIDSCDIMGGYYSIRYNGAAANKVENVRVLNSTLRDFYLYGVYTLQDQSGVIENNVISRGNRRTVSTYYGIYNSTGARNQRINKNIIRDAYSKISSSSTAFASYGIYYTGATSDSSEPNIVSNNLLYDIESLSGSYYGIYVTGGSNVLLYHNTLVLKNQASTAGLAYGIYFLGTGSNNEMKNNIIYVNRGGTGTKYCVYFGSANNLPVSNNNVLNMMSTGGTINSIGYFGSGQPTLAAWQAVNNNAFDQNSTSADPQFVDTLLNNFEPSNFAVDNIGQNLLAIVPTDLRDSARSATPDPGVYEFVVTGCLGVQNIALDSVSYDAAELSWLSASNNWQLEYGAPGFTLGTGTRVSTSTRPYLITGLTPNTTYEVYVRDSCGATQFSNWSGVFSFTTLRDYDLVATAVLSPADRACADTAVPVIVLVQNVGVLPVNGYSVDLATTGITTTTLTASSNNVVQPGAIDTLALGTISLPGAGGMLNVTTVVDGNLDVYSDNDTLLSSIEISNVPLVIVQSSADTICEGDNVSLWLDTAQGVSNVVWMDSAMNIVFSGDTLAVNNLTQTTTYFVKGAGGITSNVGPADSTIGSAAAFAATSLSVQSMLIEAFVPVKLTKAKVYVENTGWMVVMLRDLSGNEVNRDSVFVTVAGGAYSPVTVNIDLDIPVGQYRLGALTGQSAGGMLRNSTGGVYPYEIPGVFSITGNTFSTVYYYYYYDMEISTGGCETTVESRTIVVEPGTTAAFTLDSTALPSISVDASGSVNATSYRWDFGDGTTDTTMVATHTYTSNGTFTVRLIVDGGCRPDTSTQEVTIMGVSVQEMGDLNALNLYPNPNTGSFELTYTDKGLHRSEVVVMDLQGRTVYRTWVQAQSENVQVPLKIEQLAAGMYHLQLSNKKGVLRTKFKVIK